VLFCRSSLEYQPTIPGINNKDDLRRYIEERPEGVPRKDLEDAYVNGKEAGSSQQIALWVESGRVVEFMNNDSKIHMLYWYPGRLRKHPIEMEKEKEMRLKQNGQNAQNGQNGQNAQSEFKENREGVDEEIRDGLCVEELFPLIGDSIINTWNDIRIPTSKKELEHQLREANLLSAGFVGKRKRQKAVSAAGNQRKKRKRTLRNMNLTNTHMLQDEETRNQLTAANKKRFGTEREIKVAARSQ